MQLRTKNLWLEIGMLVSLASGLVAQDVTDVWRGASVTSSGPRDTQAQQTSWNDGCSVFEGGNSIVLFPDLPCKYEWEPVLESTTSEIPDRQTFSFGSESGASPTPDGGPGANMIPENVTAGAAPVVNRSGPAVSASGHEGIHWGSLLGQWWLDISFEHAERIIMEPKTRDQLNGRFFQEWFSAVAQYRYGLWNDGDKFFTSYLGHPLQGAVIEAIFWQNNDHVRLSNQDFHSRAYRKALVQAFAFATLDAVQWKLGPASEASIGHVGIPAPYCKLVYCHPRSGLNDLVMNEVGGTALTIGFQAIDKHLEVPIERRMHNRAVIDTTRVLTNPPQSLANLIRFRRPWFRDSRDDVMPHSPAH